jgi:hypothetical protein
LTEDEYLQVEREASDAERIVEQHVTWLIRQYLRGALVPAPGCGEHVAIAS